MFWGKFVHKDNECADDTDNLVEMNEEKNEECRTETGQQALVFWEAPNNLAPPSNPKPFTQANWIKMVSMMTDLK